MLEKCLDLDFIAFARSSFADHKGNSLINLTWGES